MFSLLRPAASSVLRQSRVLVQTRHARPFHASHARRRPTDHSGLTNILAGEQLAVQVENVTPEGIHLADGLVIPSACVFVEGKVFLWNVPETVWDGWSTAHLGLFEAVVPKPELLLLGTGSKAEMLPPSLRQYLNNMGIQVDVMSTRNACSTYNLLAEEGRRVAAALLPIAPQRWQNAPPA